MFTQNIKSQAKKGTFLLLVFFLMLSTSCSARSGSGSDTKPNPTLKTSRITSGDVSILVELAMTEQERNKGMMFRKSLDEGKGMLFVFESDQRMAFWMKNTSIPLSLAYLGSDGTIFQILDLVPFSEAPKLSERSIRYALEVPQGWFTKVGLKVGDKFEIPPLK